MSKYGFYPKLIVILSVVLIVFGLAGFYIGTKKAALSDNSYSKNGKASLQALKARNSLLRQRLKSLTPQENYIVVDTGMNRLYLKNGARTIREAVVSSGSGNILKDPAGKRQWVFDTPRGEYRVQTKYVAPAWTKPDWAFIEEGEAVPKDPRKRIEEGVLGAYALGFGDGYFIHGTLYTRLLGRNVTHGCIRVGDNDLKFIFNAAGIGTKIYIF